MQKFEIPAGEQEDPFLSTYQPLSPRNMFMLDREDERYLRLFLERGKTMVKPLGLLFPRACERILRTGMENPRLTHAIIAMAMYYAETVLIRSGSTARLNRYLDSFSRKTQGIPAVQCVSATSTGVPEAEIYAIFLVLRLTVMRLSKTNDIASLRHHVIHLYNLFRRAQHSVTTLNHEPLSPLLLWIWRQTMHINVTFALGVDHIPALFPPPANYVQGRPAQGHGPIRQFLGSDVSRELEAWTLAQLELDDLGNRIFRLHLRANMVRKTRSRDAIKFKEETVCGDKGRAKDYLQNFGTKELILNSQQLAHEIEKWKSKPVIQVAEYMELVHRQQTQSRVGEQQSSSNKFLHHPSLRFKNPLYACLLLTRYAMTISLSLIVDPQVGPRVKDRVDAAVEICRIYAALGGSHPVGSLTCLASVWWAGLTFEPDTKGYSLGWGLELIVEARWVRERLADPVHKGQGMRYLTHLEVVWKKAHRSWDVWTKFPIK